MNKLITFVYVMFAASFVLSGCVSGRGAQPSACSAAPQIIKTADTSTDIPFLIANGYFVRNDFPDQEPADLVIRTQTEFENIFGMATVMGPNGKPTAIDFSKQYVIAVIKKITDRAAELNAGSLKRNDGSITFSYSYHEGEKQSFSTRPALVLIVNSGYQGTVRIVRVA